MKVLIIHTYYLQSGGEDRVFLEESELLKKHGHEIVHYARSNKEIEKFSFFKKFRFICREALWNRKVYEEIRKIVRKERPNVAHVHNIFYVMSPSVYDALKDEGVPVVQTIHNFRFFAPCAILFRNGKTCERCLKKQSWLSILYGCWRYSRLSTFFLNRILAHHQRKRTFLDKIDLYIALTAFAKRKLTEAGLSPEKIAVKPNFVFSSVPVDTRKKTIFALYAGRLVEGKGILTILDAWQGLPGIPLVIIGDGPLKDKVKAIIDGNDLLHVRYLGWKNKEETQSLMDQAQTLVIPSLWYENFPMAIVESFSRKLPVIGSRIGSMNEIIEHRKTGLLFEPGNVHDLRTQVLWAWQNPKQMEEMGENAYRCYCENYDAERNYNILIKIYERACRKI